MLRIIQKMFKFSHSSLYIYIYSIQNAVKMIHLHHGFIFINLLHSEQISQQQLKIDRSVVRNLLRGNKRGL